MILFNWQNSRWSSVCGHVTYVILSVYFKTLKVNYHWTNSFILCGVISTYSRWVRVPLLSALVVLLLWMFLPHEDPSGTLFQSLVFPLGPVWGMLVIRSNSVPVSLLSLDFMKNKVTLVWQWTCFKKKI